MIYSPVEPPDPLLLRLSFDQYGRYQMMSEALAACAPLFGRPLHILDVGGYAQLRRGGEILLARAFLPMHEVYVLDQPACQLEGYIQGDGRHLQFADQSFDLVISCDAYEHVPAADRPGFWQELLRVAQAGVLLTAPLPTRKWWRVSSSSLITSTVRRTALSSSSCANMPPMACRIWMRRWHCWRNWARRAVPTPAGRWSYGWA
ncbi:MAG: class I SAM-dependent methyltransferase [Chloroflexaceae bacterium]|nr:class I SAM-dependent methyltransferase [Chloroflexaceae bacterium]